MDSESGWMVHCKVYGKRISGAALVCPNCGKAGPGLAIQPSAIGTCYKRVEGEA